MVAVGLMGAMVFVTTAYIKIGPIPTPAGPTMLKTGNILCLLAGLLFGSWRGGLAAGLGSAIYDLTDPAFISSAPFTLIRFFVMGWLCGRIAEKGKPSAVRTWTAAAAGGVVSTLLYLAKSVIGLVLLGSSFSAALAACSVKMITSVVNMVMAIVASSLLAPLFQKALRSAGILQKMQH